MLSADTPEWRERDREIVEAWFKVQGRDRACEVEGAREKLLTKLEAVSSSRVGEGEKLLSELVPAMEIRGHDPAPIREMDGRLGF
jgi:hypothetical protein